MFSPHFRWKKRFSWRKKKLFCISMWISLCTRFEYSLKIWRIFSSLFYVWSSLFWKQHHEHTKKRRKKRISKWNYSNVKSKRFLKSTGFVKTHPHSNTPSIELSTTNLEMTSSIENPSQNFFSLFNCKMVLEENVFIVEHDYADRVDLCNLTFMIFAYA